MVVVVGGDEISEQLLNLQFTKLRWVRKEVQYVGYTIERRASM